MNFALFDSFKNSFNSTEKILSKTYLIIHSKKYLLKKHMIIHSIKILIFKKNYVLLTPTWNSTL